MLKKERIDVEEFITELLFFHNFEKKKKRKAKREAHNKASQDDADNNADFVKDSSEGSSDEDSTDEEGSDKDSSLCPASSLSIVTIPHYNNLKKLFFLWKKYLE